MNLNLNVSNASSGTGGASLQTLQESLTGGTEFSPARSIPLSPDVSPANALGAAAGQHLLVDASDQYLKPVARSTTPSSVDTRLSSVSSNSSKLGNTFVSKLHEMVNDSQYQHLISWNFSGTSFVVCNIMEFSRELLPKHFKHNNFSSFVRQLNMYGFHKVNKSPRGHRTMAENQIWEFSHSKFIRERPDLLDQIKRKTMESESLRREAGDMHANFVMLQVSHTDLVKRVHHLQENLSEVLRELAETRKRQTNQENVIRQLLQTLKQQNSNNTSNSIALPSDLDIDAAMGAQQPGQQPRPSIFISDHDASSLMNTGLNYSASMSSLNTQLHLGSGGNLIGAAPSASPSPTSPLSQVGPLGTPLHHSTSNPTLNISPGANGGGGGGGGQQLYHSQSPQPQQPQQTLRTALAGDNSLNIYGRAVASPLAVASHSPTSTLSGIPGSPFYAAGSGNNLSNSSLSSVDVKSMYSTNNNSSGR